MRAKILSAGAGAVAPVVLGNPASLRLAGVKEGKKLEQPPLLCVSDHGAVEFEVHTYFDQNLSLMHPIPHE